VVKELGELKRKQKSRAMNAPGRVQPKKSFASPLSMERREKMKTKNGRHRRKRY